MNADKTMKELMPFGHMIMPSTKWYKFKDITLKEYSESKHFKISGMGRVTHRKVLRYLVYESDIINQEWKDKLTKRYL